MRVLALDTTTRTGSIAVVDAGRVIVERTGDAARSHAERLPSDLLDAVAEAGLTMAAIDLFAIASGPGSFTGIRVGIATIQGLALVYRKPVAPISALRALAEAAAAGRPGSRRVAAWMDAHRRDVFTALYDVEGEREVAWALAEREPPTVGLAPDAIARWAAGGLPDAVCGDAGARYAPLLPVSVAVVPTPPLAGILGRLASGAARDGATVGAAGVQPLYVRRPDVEVAREAAAAKS
ncbi:MAG TPA: tRNA (adenosine(37)-N6)-threonylcarbamoyltransferase complex dimerization subunit type 1 TsaB [Vicinamibacterales bacterium]|nr:tRNA (adenosine(37)-N6)-threonylcarbamoyltransferase complex dimerization subunit type 1 TsaB [Vicinamibacterales bacterium]